MKQFESYIEVNNTKKSIETRILTFKLMKCVSGRIKKLLAPQRKDKKGFEKGQLYLPEKTLQPIGKCIPSFDVDKDSKKVLFQSSIIKTV